MIYEVIWTNSFKKGYMTYSGNSHFPTFFIDLNLSPHFPNTL